MRGFVYKQYNKNNKSFDISPLVPRPVTPAEIQALCWLIFGVEKLNLNNWTFATKNSLAGIHTNKLPVIIAKRNNHFHDSYHAHNTIDGHFLWAFILGVDKYSDLRVEGQYFKLNCWNANKEFYNFHIVFPLTSHRTLKRLLKISKLIRRNEVGHLRKPYKRLAAYLRERRITA